MGILRLDPNLAVVWRSPYTVQLGAEEPALVLVRVSESEERMLAALRAGIPRDALPALGRCTQAEADAFLDRLDPVLEHPVPAMPGVRLRVRSGARDAIVRTARELGLVTGERPAPIGVVVADHAVPIAAYRDWLAAGMVHFAIVFGERSVSVGPLVVPGETACLRCADLHRRDADPVWPTIAAQLLDQPAATAADPVVRTEALCAASRIVAAASRGGARLRELPGRRFRRGGAREELRVPPHPECGCRLDLQDPFALDEAEPSAVLRPVRTG